MSINLSSRQLRAFCVLAEQRNFTRAAAATHLSQPAFSALISQFEAALGMRLFDRSTRSVELTAEGRAFEASARRILEEMDAALGAVDERVARRHGRVGVALLPSLAADWLPDVLAAFRALHPGIEFAVYDVLSEACVDAVRQGRADLALAATRANTPELRAERYCSDTFHLVCPRGHPLLKAAQLRPQDVASWPFIHLSRTSSVRQYIDASTYPDPLRAVMEVDQLATVAGMIAAGLGISIVPALALKPFVERGLATRAVGWAGLRRSIFLIRRRDKSLSLAAQTFSDFIRNRAPSAGRAPRAPRARN